MASCLSTIICSTYNKPHFLSMVLDSLRHQTRHDFSLIIADDGSTHETRELITEFRKSSPFPVEHVHHNDVGWQKSQIHNQAIAVSQTDHLIFIDGDCILSPQFFDDHLQMFLQQKENYVLMGRRVELGPKLTSRLSTQNYRQHLFRTGALPLLYSCMKSDSRGYLRRFSVKTEFLRKFLKADNVHDLLGCNFSLSKKSLIKINGFNNQMQRGEDGDIFVRLRNTGHHLIGMKYYAPMFHLFHGDKKYPEVDNYYENVLLKKKDYLKCKDGLNRYL